MRTDILVTRTTLKRFGVIPWSFPQIGNGGYKYKEYRDAHCSFQTKVEGPESKLPDELAAEVKCILNKYEDVLSDTLVNDRFLGKEANIVFNDVRVKPICVQTARSPPRAFEDNAKKALDELIERNKINQQFGAVQPIGYQRRTVENKKTDAGWSWISKD